MSVALERPPTPFVIGWLRADMTVLWLRVRSHKLVHNFSSHEQIYCMPYDHNWIVPCFSGVMLFITDGHPLLRMFAAVYSYRLLEGQAVQVRSQNITYSTRETKRIGITNYQDFPKFFSIMEFFFSEIYEFWTINVLMSSVNSLR